LPEQLLVGALVGPRETLPAPRFGNCGEVSQLSERSGRAIGRKKIHVPGFKVFGQPDAHALTFPANELFDFFASKAYWNFRHTNKGDAVLATARALQPVVLLLFFKPTFCLPGEGIYSVVMRPLVLEGESQLSA